MTPPHWQSALRAAGVKRGHLSPGELQALRILRAAWPSAVSLDTIHGALNTDIRVRIYRLRRRLRGSRLRVENHYAEGYRLVVGFD